MYLHDFADNLSADNLSSQNLSLPVYGTWPKRKTLGVLLMKPPGFSQFETLESAPHSGAKSQVDFESDLFDCR